MIEATVGTLRLDHPIMNGAGWGCKTLEEVRLLAATPVSAIVVGSITLEPRSGNPGNVYWADPLRRFSLNSLGLPNRGWPYYGELLQQMRRVAHDAKKPLIVSIACFSPEEYAKLAGFVADQDVDMIELNLGCPNVWGQDGQKPIASYEPRIVENILALVREEIRHSTSPNVAVAAKISPLPPSILNEVAAVIAEMGIIDVVTATNTLPNGFMWNDTKPAIEAGGGLAGVAGASLKPIAMGVVKQLCDLLPAHFDIIAVGGIEYGQDVLDYLRIGPKVKAVQVVTAYANQGPKVFDRILSEFVGLQTT